MIGYDKIQLFFTRSFLATILNFHSLFANMLLVHGSSCFELFCLMLLFCQRNEVNMQNLTGRISDGIHESENQLVHCSFCVNVMVGDGWRGAKITISGFEYLLDIEIRQFIDVNFDSF